MEKKVSLRVEFKSEAKSPIPDHELLDEIVGMANAEGGVIYLGVEDSGLVTGVSEKHQDVDGLSAMVANKTMPSVFVNAYLKEEEGCLIVVIEVPLMKNVVATSSGKVTQRRIKIDGTQENVPFFPYEYSSRASFLTEYDPSSAIVPSLDISSISMDSLHVLRLEMKKYPTSDAPLFDLSDEEFLSSLGLVRNDNGRLNMTYAGLLMLGKEEDIAKYAPGASFVYQILQKGEVLKNEEAVENIIQAFTRFSSFCESFNFFDEMMINMRRADIPYFSFEGLREAFANAVAHRDYSKLGAIRVIYDEAGLSISNPGGLIYGLKADRLLFAEPRGRNPLLSLALKRCGYCEKTGRGVDKIYYGQARYGKRWPDYSSTNEGSVTLFIPKSEIDEPFARKMMEEEKLPICSVLILAHIRERGIASNNELAKRLGIGEERLGSYLYPLEQRRIIEATSENGLWKINGDYLASKNGEEINDELLLDKAIALAKENGGILTNAYLQRKLDLLPSKAYSILKKLCERKKVRIVQTGKYSKYELI